MFISVRERGGAGELHCSNVIISSFLVRGTIRFIENNESSFFKTIHKHGIDRISYDDKEKNRPKAVFPKNWYSELGNS